MTLRSRADEPQFQPDVTKHSTLLGSIRQRQLASRETRLRHEEGVAAGPHLPLPPQAA